ncbi:DNA alkylation repair protein, partial [Candidatus Roizmanbacteria bacterium]|nr:DNA alkylation repair protein [Candidatus Roizmanbacteria bacterium]
MLGQLKKDLLALQNKEKAVILSRFFKTGKGEYGEGDIFLGITVPQQRSIAKKYPHLKLSDIERLLTSKIHEERLIGLLILVEQFKKGNEKEKKAIFDFYLRHTAHINNWDLVD